MLTGCLVTQAGLQHGVYYDQVCALRLPHSDWCDWYERRWLVRPVFGHLISRLRIRWGCIGQWSDYYFDSQVPRQRKECHEGTYDPYNPAHAQKKENDLSSWVHLSQFVFTSWHTNILWLLITRKFSSNPCIESSVLCVMQLFLVQSVDFLFQKHVSEVLFQYQATSAPTFFA